jgi:hypothetical protein
MTALIRAIALAAVVSAVAAFDPASKYVDGKINVHLVCHTYVPTAACFAVSLERTRFG